MSAALQWDTAPRKCRSCRYWKDAGVASSGWCTHPERGELHQLVLVRSSELACRDVHDDDLWEPGAVHVATRVVHDYINGIH